MTHRPVPVRSPGVGDLCLTPYRQVGGAWVGVKGAGPAALIGWWGLWLTGSCVRRRLYRTLHSVPQCFCRTTEPAAMPLHPPYTRGQCWCTLSTASWPSSFQTNIKGNGRVVNSNFSKNIVLVNSVIIRAFSFPTAKLINVLLKVIWVDLDGYFKESLGGGGSLPSGNRGS